MKQILVVDDDPLFRDFLREALARRSHSVDVVESGEEALRQMKEVDYDLVLTDIRMPGMNGIQVLEKAGNLQPDAKVVMVTAHATVANAVEAMHKGAFDYIEKGCSLEEIEIRVDRALENQQLKQENVRLRSELQERYSFGNMVGKSQKMEDVFELIQIVSKSRSTVLITGESGTGKELVARAIHYSSPRRNGPFIKLNCAALPQDLIESELFGHEKGSFTGATESKAGKFELCNGGTIFLDEVGDMSLSTQTKILRAIQEGEVQRVGGIKIKRVDVRVIAATNRNLESMVKTNDFREDLYYRLNVVRIRLPALRERMEDLPELVDFIIQRLGQKGKTRVTEISRDVLDALSRYDWPGNVRELENVVQSSSVVAQGKRILMKDLPEELWDAAGMTKTSATSKAPIQGAGEPEPATVEADAPRRRLVLGDKVEPNDKSSSLQARDAGGVSMEETFDFAYSCVRERNDNNLLQAVEKEIIQRCLQETGGNQVKASKLLGITRATLRKRIDLFEIRY